MYANTNDDDDDDDVHGIIYNTTNIHMHSIIGEVKLGRSMKQVAKKWMQQGEQF